MLTEKKLKNKKTWHGWSESWQYIMLAAAIFIAIIFCCYYIVSQSRWGFYTSGGIRDPETSKLDFADEESLTSTQETEDEIEENKTEEVSAQSENDENIKRAYLTFDDGPSDNTGEILDILDANNVKATFFVVGREEKYYDTYRDIVNRGHTLGLHSYTHDYGKIYASLDDFAEDIEELQKLLYDVTGVSCVYYRFPGGSSNTVSKVDMDTLIDYVNNKGLVYYDWNALNNDAVCGSFTPQQLVDNIMKDAVSQNDVVILMHDLTARHTTVESLQQLIDELREQGFTLLPIDENAPLIRHRT